MMFVLESEEVRFGWWSRGGKAASELSTKCQKQPNDSLVFHVCRTGRDR